MGDSGQEATSLSVGGLSPSPQSRVMEAMGVAFDRAQLIVSGLSAGVVKTTLHSRAPSTRKQYALKWAVFPSWCGNRQLIALVCPVRALDAYVHRAAQWRKTNQVFICFGPLKKGLLETKQTSSRWIVESSDLPSPLGVKAQSTRNMVASKALLCKTFVMWWAGPLHSQLLGSTV